MRNETQYRSPFCVYQDAVRTVFTDSGEEAVYARHVTQIPPLSLILFGLDKRSLQMEMEIDGLDMAALNVNGTVRLQLEPAVLKQISEVKTRLENLFQEWVTTAPGDMNGEEWVNIKSVDRENAAKRDKKFLDTIVELLQTQQPVSPPHVFGFQPQRKYVGERPRGRGARPAEGGAANDPRNKPLRTAQRTGETLAGSLRFREGGSNAATGRPSLRLRRLMAKNQR